MSTGVVDEKMRVLVRSPMFTVITSLPQHGGTHNGERLRDTDPTQTVSHCHFILYLRIDKKRSTWGRR